MRSFALAITFTLATAENLLDVDQTRRELTTAAPNIGITTEGDCDALESGSTYYSYVWNTDGCYCEHQWSFSASWNSCGSGFVNNPFHEPGNYADICISDADYAALDLDNCIPPEPTCEELIGDPTGYATVHLKSRGVADATNPTGFESGFLIFQEMCGDACGDSTCEGTCISGNFWGLFRHPWAGAPDYYNL